MAVTEKVEHGSAVEPTNCVSCGSFCCNLLHVSSRDISRRISDISKHIIYTKLAHSCSFPLECAVFCFRIGCRSAAPVCSGLFLKLTPACF